MRDFLVFDTKSATELGIYTEPVPMGPNKIDGRLYREYLKMHVGTLPYLNSIVLGYVEHVYLNIFQVTCEWHTQGAVSLVFHKPSVEEIVEIIEGMTRFGLWKNDQDKKDVLQSMVHILSETVREHIIPPTEEEETF